MKKSLPLSTIYLDTGSNFNKNEYLNLPLNIKGKSFNIAINTPSNVKAIRFDPFEGKGCIITDLNIINNEENINYLYINGTNIDDIIFLDNLDPQIAVDLKEHNSLVIKGNIYSISKYHLGYLTKYKEWLIKKNRIRRFLIKLNLYIFLFKLSSVFLSYFFTESVKQKLFSFKNKKNDKKILFFKKNILSYSSVRFDDNNTIPKLQNGIEYSQYAVKLYNCSFIGASNIISFKNRVLYDLPFYDKKMRYNYTDPQIVKLKNKHVYYNRNKEFIKINNVIWMGGSGSYNYYHLMYEFAIKFLILNKLNIPVYIPVYIDKINNDVKQFKELLELMNYKKYTLIPVEPGVRYKTNEFFFINCPNFIPSNFTNDNDIKKEDVQFDIDLLKELREYLLPFSSDTQYPEKIFLSRKNASGVRKFNEQEIIDVFISKGFEVVYPETLSIPQQISLFKNAKYIAGGSGAAFTNLLFCNNKCKCIIFSKAQFQLTIFSTIAYITGTDLRYLTEEAVKGSNYNSIHDPFEIDIMYLKKKLADWEWDK